MNVIFPAGIFSHSEETVEFKRSTIINNQYKSISILCITRTANDITANALFDALYAMKTLSHDLKIKFQRRTFLTLF